MTKNCKAAMAAGVAGGYVLGRTRKAKLAFAVATYLVGRRFSLSPSQLLTEGVERLRQTPQFQELSDQFKGQIMTAGRDALSAAAGRRVADMTDRIRDHTEHLRGAAEGTPQGSGDKAGEGGEPPGRRPPGRKAAGTAKTAAGKAADTAGGTGAAARKAAGGTGGAARRAAGGTQDTARRAAGGAGTTARKTSRSAGAAARRTAAGAGSAAGKATTAQRAAAKKRAVTRTSGGEGRSPESRARR